MLWAPPDEVVTELGFLKTAVSVRCSCGASRRCMGEEVVVVVTGLPPRGALGDVVASSCGIGAYREGV